VGVEEELLLFTSAATPAAEGEHLAADPGTSVEHELKLEQAEIASEPRTDADELAADLLGRRRELAAAASERDVRVAGLATSPVHVAPRATPDERYERMHERFAGVVVDQLTCGAHVHVSVDSRAEGVAVLDRIRAWLPTLVAVSANSPFWTGHDSGYASFRSIAWGRWPSAGPIELLGDVEAYDAIVTALVASGAALDDGMVYFDARLSARYPTVEIRVADVGQQVSDSVLLALLCRGLVDTAAADPSAPPDVPTELIRAAAWRAARYGLADELFDPVSRVRRAAADQLDRLVEHVRPALVASGDAERVDALVAGLLARGGGAQVQRADLARTGSPRGVVEAAEQRLLH